ATGLHCGCVHTGRRAPNRANRKSNQFSARPQSRIHITKPSANGAANTSGSARRLAVKTFREVPGYSSRGAKLGRGQRHHRRGKGGLFPVDYARSGGWLSKFGAGEFLLGFEENMSFHSTR